MSVRLAGETVHLEGDCRVEDAEPLLAMLQADPTRQVELTAAGGLHTAVVQVMLAIRPRLSGVPADPFAVRWLMPLLQGEQPD
jgi:hypothetical protein